LGAVVATDKGKLLTSDYHKAVAELPTHAYYKFYCKLTYDKTTVKLQDN
jgi:hypothetical protein